MRSCIPQKQPPAKTARSVESVIGPFFLFERITFHQRKWCHSALSILSEITGYPESTALGPATLLTMLRRPSPFSVEQEGTGDEGSTPASRSRRHCARVRTQQNRSSTFPSAPIRIGTGRWSPT